MRRTTRGAVAGAAAAALWKASDPVFDRIFGTPYSDARLVSAFVSRGPLQPVVGTALHAAAGAAFGWTFAHFGGRGVRQAVIAALAENAALWPTMLLFDRIHPSRRDGSWPPLFANGRVLATATAGHAYFGMLLGLFLDGRR